MCRLREKEMVEGPITGLLMQNRRTAFQTRRTLLGIHCPFARVITPEDMKPHSGGKTFEVHICCACQKEMACPRVQVVLERDPSTQPSWGLLWAPQVARALQERYMLAFKSTISCHFSVFMRLTPDSRAPAHLGLCRAGSCLSIRCASWP